MMTAADAESLADMVEERDQRIVALAKQDLEWAVANGLNSHLPTLEEVRAAGPYVRVGWDETLDEASARARREPQ